VSTSNHKSYPATLKGKYAQEEMQCILLPLPEPQQAGQINFSKAGQIPLDFLPQIAHLGDIL